MSRSKRDDRQERGTTSQTGDTAIARSALSAALRGLPARRTCVVPVLSGAHPSPDIDMPALQRASFTRGHMLVLPINSAQAQWLTRRKRLSGAAALVHPRAQIRWQHAPGATTGY